MAAPTAAATAAAAALSVWLRCGTSADSTSVRKLKCGRPSSRPHRQRTEVEASGPPLPRWLRVFLPPEEQGLTLVHFSAQHEPFLTQNAP